MLNVDIRFCEASDLPELLELNALSPYPWSESVIRADFSEALRPLSYLGAFSFLDDRLLGYAVLGTEAKEALLMNLNVQSDFRRRGVGLQLVAAVAECATALGFSNLALRVRESNMPALALYCLLGFRRTGTALHYYSNGESALLLSAELPLEIPSLE
ncbi:MAG: GNAT family N-acetyltransferase [Fretibacterium sp.]|nr:GNAT family N-acetyltransferase [Fretibacterium sp.]